jgi:hypothetical protein
MNERLKAESLNYSMLTTSRSDWKRGRAHEARISQTRCSQACIRGQLHLIANYLNPARTHFVEHGDVEPRGPVDRCFPL